VNYSEALQVDPEWLPLVEDALSNEGFSGHAPQLWKPGQRSGWVKRLDGGNQYHVRLFNNGIIQPEEEVGFEYIEHPGTSKTAIEPIKLILYRYQIPFQITYTEPYTQNGHVPASRTPLLGVLAIGVLAIAFIASLFSIK
jgi:hypothetical protein